MQGYHVKCGTADLLFSAADNNQGGHCDQELGIPVLAAVHDERSERKPVDCLWQSERKQLTCPALPCLPCCHSQLTTHMAMSCAAMFPCMV